MVKEHYDYLIVGAGPFSTTIAERAHRAGKKVLVIDKRDHIAGNVYTENQDGINVHKYGAHIFHTDYEDVWQYVNQFAEFNHFINSPIAIFDGNVYNINADLAAAQIAAKLGAKKLILMTDIRGLLRDVNDENSLISVVNVSEVPMLKRDGIIKGGMIPKIDCCVEAVRSGVNRAHIIDGRLDHSILLELFSDDGIGTMFYQVGR